SVQATAAALGGAPVLPEPPTSGGPGMEAVEDALDVRTRLLDG
ncbi:MAG: hypothetical protein QOJ67_2387, partial [Acidimicrobiaceae bacterium]